MTRRRAVSNIIAVLILIGLAVVGSGVYYLAVTSFMRPQPALSSGVSISAGPSGFAIIDVEVINTGGVPFESLSIGITGPSSSQLQITYSAFVGANGGGTTMTVRGVSGGPYSPLSSSTSVSGNLVAMTGSSYVVTVQASLTNGGTYQQAYSISAQP